eukprot:2603244-Pleurochrysis_carterae.AAC.1
MLPQTNTSREALKPHKRGNSDSRHMLRHGRCTGRARLKKGGAVRHAGVSTCASRAMVPKRSPGSHVESDAESKITCELKTHTRARYA